MMEFIKTYPVNAVLMIPTVIVILLCLKGIYNEVD